MAALAKDLGLTPAPTWWLITVTPVPGNVMPLLDTNTHTHTLPAEVWELNQG